MSDRLIADPGATQPLSSARKRAISGTTATAALVMFGLLAAFSYFNSLSYAGGLPEPTDTIVYVFVIGLVPLAAIIAILGVTRFASQDPLRRQWQLLALAITAFAIGDIVWMIIELGLGQDPYPSFADVFYVAEYAFFLAAAIVAIRSYRRLVPITGPVMIGGIGGWRQYTAASVPTDALISNRSTDHSECESPTCPSRRRAPVSRPMVQRTAANPSGPKNNHAEIGRAHV